MEKEVWKTIKDYPEYEISNWGNIRSWKNGVYGIRSRPKRLKPAKDLHGYFRAAISKNNKSHTKKLHRLVLGAFVGPCPDGMEACHNDGNPGNNNVENLRWDTRKNNQADRKKHGTINSAKGERQGSAKLKDSDVIKIREMAKRGLYQVIIAERFNICIASVARIVHRKTWRHI